MDSGVSRAGLPPIGISAAHPPAAWSFPEVFLTGTLVILEHRVDIPTADKPADHLDGRSLMIHAGGDNHSDAPAPLGGGAQVASRVVPAMGT